VAFFILRSSFFIVVGCNTGSYPLDVFPEMHYQPSQRALEPDRRSPPDGAVPIGGGAPRLTFEQAAGLANPLARTPETGAAGRRVYEVNCVVCHGGDGRGGGAMAAYYGRGAAAPVPPTDLASPRVRARTDGQLWWIVRRGLGNMPPFEDLLTEDEVWLVVQLIREVQGR
jgi:mono/diheme cytochrome c family protein